MDYAILCHPGHNRVYFESSFNLSISEFIIVSKRLSTQYNSIGRQNISGIDYLTFRTEDELSENDVKILSELSFVYAIFKIETIDQEIYLKPVKRLNVSFVDEGISSILKYTGKTNEIFTRMMINIAFYSQNSNDNIRLLDPISGKGTTLYEGLIKGFNVYGIEISDTVVNESYHFLKRFLENAKYKFETSSIKISGPNKSFSALKHSFKTAKTKEDFKLNNAKNIELIAGNSLYANMYFKKNFFDLIVGDLPYGVQHGNVTSEKQSTLTRNPSELLKACLPSWVEVLKPNGVIVLSWNSNVLNRNKLALILEEKGLTVKNEVEYLHFEHRVDQAILRDIIVAQKHCQGDGGLTTSHCQGDGGLTTS